MSDATFEAVVLEAEDQHLERHRGRLRIKPSMTVGHNRSARTLGHQLWTTVSDDHCVFQHRGYFRASDHTILLPDVAIVPVALVDVLAQDPTRFEVYDDPISFVADVWFEWTDIYDLFEQRFAAYKLRGDAEIWRVHPFDRIVNIWRRQPEGEYTEATVTGGRVRLHALPSVTVEIEALFVAE